jgi:enolase-phosphatase E1
VFWAAILSGPREFELNLPLLPDISSTFCFLLDIEGTTSSVDFVYKTLFPFASANAEQYLRRHFGEPDLQSLLAELRREHGPEGWNAQTEEAEIASAASYVKQLIAQDRKVTPLKTLQGKVWEEGYRSGDLQGHVYEDVPRAFSRWRAAGKRIAIFSSGSMLAQKLLFGHSTAGDVTKYIEAYFDTTTGPKKEAASYTAIAKQLQNRGEQILFVSDIEAELDAAKQAGMHTALMVRPGAAETVDARHAKINSFDEL